MGKLNLTVGKVFQLATQTGIVLFLMVNSAFGEEGSCEVDICKWLSENKAQIRQQINFTSEELLFTQIKLKHEGLSIEEIRALEAKISYLRAQLVDLRDYFDDLQWERQERCESNRSPIQSQSPSQASSM